jgi:imidazole glycerol-phosphate synthase subunit HisH
VIAIIDYGCGNTYAFTNAFKCLNMPSIVANTVDEVESANKIILPGVGSFDYVMQSFNSSGLRRIVEKKVVEENVSVLGVCAGMQIFAEESDEGNEKGLGWVKGKIRLFDTVSIKHKTKLPHMGWNTIRPKKSLLFNEINDESRFYFIHSYYFDNSNNEDMISTSNYGGIFTSSINKNNIYGVQFHPEKSHQNGLMLLKNFAEL